MSISAKEKTDAEIKLGFLNSKNIHVPPGRICVLLNEISCHCEAVYIEETGCSLKTIIRTQLDAVKNLFKSNPLYASKL